MTRLLLIRHGESEANRQDIFAGHINPDLLERGLAQAKFTAEFVASNFKVDKIYSSDLQRAYKTACALGERLGLEVIKEQGMREIRAGEWEGEVFGELAEKFPEDFYVWMHDISKARCTGGESVAELNRRIMETVRKIAEENDGKTVAVATHATPIRVIISNIQTGGIEKMNMVPWVSNASVSVIEYENGEWKALEVSLDSHLAELKTVLPDNV